MHKLPRVLLAEDEELHSYPLMRALIREGFDVNVVRDGEAVRSGGLDVDALVIDARLPKVALEGVPPAAEQGISAAADLVNRGLDPRVPLVFISVYPDTADNVQHAFERYPVLKGRYIWMQKWFEPRVLAKQIRALLEKMERDGKQ